MEGIICSQEDGVRWRGWEGVGGGGMRGRAVCGYSSGYGKKERRFQREVYFELIRSRGRRMEEELTENVSVCVWLCVWRGRGQSRQDVVGCRVVGHMTCKTAQGGGGSIDDLLSRLPC